MSPMSPMRFILTGPLVLLLLSCGQGADMAPASERPLAQEEEGGWADEAAPPPAPGGPMGGSRSEAAKSVEADRFAMPAVEAAPAAPEPEEQEEKGRGNDEEAAAPATRSWFPETFLFAPAVVTDAQGLAEVPVTVPDRLTTWRILALAHDRQGHQAGDLTSFLGTLPVYVEPVVPAFLVAGDRVILPVQVVNTTDGAWSGELSVEVSGAATSAFAGRVEVPAMGSRVLSVPLSAPRAGELSLSVRLGLADAVVRAIPVLPAGQRLEQVRGGTLASPRSVELEGPDDMDPHSARVRVVVFPGALSVLRRELARAEAGAGGVADDAHALLLAGSAPALLEALGEVLKPVRASG